MKQKDVYLILVPTLILTILWVLFSFYHNYVTSTISTPLKLQIKPIDATFDTKTIDKLKDRRKVNPSYELEGIPQEPVTIPEPEPTPVEEEVSTEGAQLQ